MFRIGWWWRKNSTRGSPASYSPSPTLHPHTLSDAGSEIEEDVIIAQILSIHTRLTALETLSPSPDVNSLFGELVALCTKRSSSAVIKKVFESKELTKALPSIRHICGTAECELEKYWSGEIAGQIEEKHDVKAVRKRLLAFPYIQNYIDLTRLETAALAAVGIDMKSLNVAFIGSGPLPLSGLCLCGLLPSSSTFHEVTEWKDGSRVTEEVSVLNIDHNPEAIAQSRRLCERLGVTTGKMQFLCQGAGDGGYDLRRFDVVYLAALVGSSQEEKEELLVKVVGGMREGAVIVARSSTGLRECLYAAFDPVTDRLRECIDVEVVLHPYNHVVNSIIVGRVRDRSGARDGFDNISVRGTT